MSNHSIRAIASGADCSLIAHEVRCSNSVFLCITISELLFLPRRFVKGAAHRRGRLGHTACRVFVEACFQGSAFWSPGVRNIERKGDQRLQLRSRCYPAFSSTNIISRALLSSGALLKDPYSCFTTRPASMNNARRCG